jgi:signal transduction histidine kinase/Na+/proline symporter
MLGSPTVAIALPLGMTIVYLLGLTTLSEWVERRPALQVRAGTPIVYGAALGVYATTWTFYGSVGFAERHGYGFLAISLGVVLSCLAIPVLWLPLARLLRRHHLASVADLLAFRHRSQAVGLLITLFLVAGLLPYYSLQLRAISDAARHLAGDVAPAWLGPAYAILLSVFAAGLGTRFAEPSRRRPGLIAALAFETIVKTSAILVVGGVALFGVFGGFGGLTAHLEAHPEALATLTRPVREEPFGALLLASFAAAFLLPRQFHIAFVQAPSERALRHASWVLPLVLLFLNLPLPILYWAGQVQAAPGTSVDLYVFAAVAHSPAATLLAFLGGLSAASAMILISGIALSEMIANHIVLPLWARNGRPFTRLPTLRRAVVVGLVATAFVVHLVLPRQGTLVDLGLVSFAAVVQLLPGVLGLLFWPRGSRAGLLVGLVLGSLTWVLVSASPVLGSLIGLEVLADEPRGPAFWLGLMVNGAAYGVVSLLWPPTAEERETAQLCVQRARTAKAPRVVPTVGELEALLAKALGPADAAEEIARACRACGVSPDESRDAGLRCVLEEVEESLSRLVGPLVATVVLGRVPRVSPGAVTAQLHFLERLTLPPEVAPAPVELVRRYLVGVLEDLPLGLCAVDGTGRVAVWNRALAELSGVDRQRAVGGTVASLPAPFDGFVRAALRAQVGGVLERTLPREHDARVLRFRHSALGEEGGHTLLVEDLTERRQLLAQVRHQDRLASVGRVAAGVAHEIGNPLTGLMMVTRNLREEPEAEDAPERLGLILHEAGRIQRIVESMLDFSRRDRAPRGERTYLAPLLRDAIGLASLGRRARVRFELEVDERLSIDGEGHRLSQVFVNLLANAADASPEDSVVWAVARTRPGTVSVDVVDEGPGVPTELAPRLFEPFFTTKDPGEGTGLGLAVSYRIVEEHGGTLTFRRVGDRTVFTVTLPQEGPPTLDEEVREALTLDDAVGEKDVVALEGT